MEWPTATDLFIYVDTSMPFNQIQPAVNRMLDDLALSFRAESNITILGAMDSAAIVESTRQSSSVASSWNAARHTAG